MSRKTLIPVWFFLLIIFWATSLIGDVKKTLPPAPPETQEECDQTAPKATSSDSIITAPKTPSNEKAANSSPFTPPPFQTQESTSSGG